MRQYKVHVTYGDGRDAEVFTDDRDLAYDFFRVFDRNPAVAEVTASRRSERVPDAYIHVLTATRQHTTLPL